MREWMEIPIGELGAVVTGKTPSQNNPEDWGDETLFVTPTDYGSYNKVADQSVRMLSSIGTERFSKKLVPPGSVLVTCIGSDMGRVVISGKQSLTNQQINSIIVDDQVADRDFVYYNLLNRDEELKVLGSSGSAVPLLNKGDFEKVTITLPALEHQRAIASVLSSLDAKIDLLHRQNKTLEAMAETLFRQWFLERRPEEFEGEAEEGWEEGTVNDLVEIQSGFAFKSKTFAEAGTFRLVTIKAVQDGYLELSNASWLLSAPAKMQPYCKLQLGDILLSLTGNVGRVCLVDEERLLLNQRVAKLHSRNDDNWAFTYVLFRQASFRSLLEETAKGTAQPNLSPIETAQLSIKIPPSQKLMKFDEVATPVLRRVLLNKRSIREITALRDTLLPKLMSGEVRVEHQEALSR